MMFFLGDSSPGDSIRDLFWDGENVTLSRG